MLSAYASNIVSFDDYIDEEDYDSYNLNAAGSLLQEHHCLIVWLLGLSIYFFAAQPECRIEFYHLGHICGEQAG